MTRSTNRRADRRQGHPSPLLFWGRFVQQQSYADAVERREAGSSAPVAALPPPPRRRGWLRPPCA